MITTSVLMSTLPSSATSQRSSRIFIGVLVGGIAVGGIVAEGGHYAGELNCRIEACSAPDLWWSPHGSENGSHDGTVGQWIGASTVSSTAVPTNALIWTTGK